MSEISGLRGLPHSASLSAATVPRFGVQTDEEGQLAKVGPRPRGGGPGLSPGSARVLPPGPVPGGEPSVPLGVGATPGEPEGSAWSLTS